MQFIYATHVQFEKGLLLRASSQVKRELNAFPGTWLRYLKAQGHKVPQLDTDSSG